MGALLVKYWFPVNWLDFKRLLYIGDAGSNQVIQTSHGLFNEQCSWQSVPNMWHSNWWDWNTKDLPLMVVKVEMKNTLGLRIHLRGKILQDNTPVEWWLTGWLWREGWWLKGPGTSSLLCFTFIAEIFVDGWIIIHSTWYMYYLGACLVVYVRFTIISKTGLCCECKFWHLVAYFITFQSDRMAAILAVNRIIWS